MMQAALTKSPKQESPEALNASMQIIRENLSFEGQTSIGLIVINTISAMLGEAQKPLVDDFTIQISDIDPNTKWHRTTTITVYDNQPSYSCVLRETMNYTGQHTPVRTKVVPAPYTLSDVAQAIRACKKPAV